MGVPVVTLAGPAHWSRIGVSLLSAAGLAELVAEDFDDYVEIAGGLAADEPRRRELRTALRPQLRRSPLLDARRAALSLETALRQIWRERVNSTD
jgi:predicted O-linked N-acetylglucosamine transferase (SPINDLY family)